MSLNQMYLSAIKELARPARELKPVYPEGWKQTDEPQAMLVLAGGRVLDEEDWPAVALVFARGTYLLGRSIAGAAFPRSLSLPMIFEGHQCLLEVAEEVRILEDYSTNGTLVVPPNEVRKTSSLRLVDALRKQWDLPCPKAVHPNDVVLTIYAELVLVNLRA